MSIAQSLLSSVPPAFTAPSQSQRKSSKWSSRAPKLGGNSAGVGLHILLSSPVQSATPIVRSVCATHPCVLVLLDHASGIYLSPTQNAVQVVDARLWGNPYHPRAGKESLAQLAQRIDSAVQAVRLNQPTSRAGVAVVIESVQPLLDAPSPQGGVREAVQLVQKVLASLSSTSTGGKLICVVNPDSDFTSRTSQFVGHLQSSSIWPTASPSTTTSSSVKVSAQDWTCTSTLVPLSFARMLQTEYALSLPTTSSDDQNDLQQDPRLWPLVSTLVARSMMGSPDDLGWWTSLPLEVRGEMESVRAPSRSFKKDSHSSESEQSHLSGLLISFARSPLGKREEQVVGIKYEPTQDAQLRVVPLTAEVVEQLQPSRSTHAASTDAQPVVAGISSTAPSPNAGGHAALLASLPFNLNETASQRAQRASVQLPHQAAQAAVQGTSIPPGKTSGVVFHPEDVDDLDEEEYEEEED